MADLDLGPDYGYWSGWLVEDLADQKDVVFDQLEKAINDRKIPMYGNRKKDESVEVKRSTINMWFRSDTPQLEIKSEMDGVVKGWLCVQDYGTSLWISFRVEKQKNIFENWAKSMAWSAFRLTLEGVVSDALANLHEGRSIERVYDEAAPRIKSG